MSALSEQWTFSGPSKNRLLIIGVGLASVLAWTWAKHRLEDYRTKAQIPLDLPRSQYINQATEDALKPQTLFKLIQSPNYGIADIASRIVLDRALHSPETLDALLWEVTRADHERREWGIRALHLLTESSKIAFLLSHTSADSSKSMRSNSWILQRPIVLLSRL